MPKYKHNFLKELWWNRPTKYIPEVIKLMQMNPFGRSATAKFRLWFRNMLYLSWQTCLVEIKEETE